jgi:hypothetical protein
MVAMVVRLTLIAQVALAVAVAVAALPMFAPPVIVLLVFLTGLLATEAPSEAVLGVLPHKPAVVRGLSTLQSVPTPVIHSFV